MEFKPNNDMTKRDMSALAATMDRVNQETGPIDDLETGRETYETLLETLRQELVNIKIAIDELLENRNIPSEKIAPLRSELERIKRISRSQLIDTSAEVRKINDQLQAIKQQIAEQN